MGRKQNSSITQKDIEISFFGVWFSGLWGVVKVLDLMVGAGGKRNWKGKDTNLRIKKHNNKTIRLFTVPIFLNVTRNLIYKLFYN